MFGWKVWDYMQQFSVTPRGMLANFWSCRSLIQALIKREVMGRYRGSMMGVLWSFFHPLFMLFVYAFVFGGVFKAHTMVGYSKNKSEFFLVLFIGLLVFNLFSECLNRAPNLMVVNQNFVKKVAFPLDIISWVSVLIGLCAWLLFYLVEIGLPHRSMLLFPLALAPLLLMIVGISWILSSLGVFLRDISHLTGLLSTGLMFLSPVFYPLSSLPLLWQHILLFNPITIPLETMRSILFASRPPDWPLLLCYSACSVFMICLGFFWFQTLRKGFADVL
jgi:lipopolysaccharide transport system permease protein